ncbi:hypothetical protein [Virgibacillus salexigens]|uniref:Permease n=1 Tax=Virgibacillus kapii TaxID=1638645 RepID=A0ABQ2D4A9_9BACI|nr:hypothetical protein [Virgibacillus kapii]GGJ42036.1 hypothetical protein GCM10007111_00300 [Virgibacillus kapii]
MKSTFMLPKTRKGWISLALIVFVIILGSWPVIPFFNKETIVFGMPMLMLWSIVIIVITTSTLWFINKIGGVK